MIDHIAFEVHPNQLHSKRMDRFMGMLNLFEIDASDEIKEGWDVRWFVQVARIPGDQSGKKWQTLDKPEIHLVAGDEAGPAPLGLTHFCIIGVGEDGMERCRQSEWLEHERKWRISRLWVCGPSGIRVEVRP